MGAVAGQGRWRGGGVRVEAGTGGLGRFFFLGLGQAGMRSGVAWGPCRVADAGGGAAAEAVVNVNHWGNGFGEQPFGRGESGVWASMGWGLLRVGWLDTLGP